MRAATGLQVDRWRVGFAADADGADAPGAAWGLHAHAFDQRGVRVQFFIADRGHGEWVRGSHQGGDGGGQLLLVQRVCHRKVQPRVVGRDGAAVDQLRHHMAQQVAGGVQAHHAVAALPVDAGGDSRARRELRHAVFLPGGGDVNDVAGGVAVGVLALAGVGNGDLCAVCQHQHAAVTGLAAAQGVEHGLVQHDAGIGDGGDVGAAFAQVGVLAEEVLGHGKGRAHKISAWPVCGWETDMQITRLKLKNWRNFREADIPLAVRTHVLGANASGKSNFLDVFRFLRTVAQTDGGGVQKALKDRGGLTKLRSLHARRDPEVRIELELMDDSGPMVTRWRYVLGLKSEGKGQQRVLVSEERVEKNGKLLLDRPHNQKDKEDPERLTQTHLEQIGSNLEFRALADFFASTTYLHLVPQLLKHGDEIGARIPESDPFGQGLMQRIAQTPKKTRDARLKRIQKALENAVPLFSELRFEQDPISGLWHLEANFTHWRVHGSWQRENQLSDGTLRLIGLLWALQEAGGLLLLEEPEQSLNDAIVAHIPLLIDRVLRDRKRRTSSRQVVISTHSDILLQNVDGGSQSLLIEPGENGSTVREPNESELEQIQHGLTPAEVLLPKTRPQGVQQMGLWV